MRHALDYIRAVNKNENIGCRPHIAVDPSELLVTMARKSLI
jgi:hypothetical protein